MWLYAHLLVYIYIYQSCSATIVICQWIICSLPTFKDKWSDPLLEKHKVYQKIYLAIKQGLNNKFKNMQRLKRKEASMLHWMSNISRLIQQSMIWEKNWVYGRLDVVYKREGWYGHVVHMNKGSCINMCWSLIARGTCGKGRSRKTGDKVEKVFRC